MKQEHPIWLILDHQGRSLTWLARKSGISLSHVKNVKCGFARMTPKFRMRCAEALDLPEQVLFISDVCPTNATDVQDGHLDLEPDLPEAANA